MVLVVLELQLHWDLVGLSDQGLHKDLGHSAFL